MTSSARDRILFVDDDKALRLFIEKLLGKAGFSCVSAPTAEEALAWLKNEPVSVVIADIRLPGMDGLELLARIKNAHDADVIMVTGYGDHHSYEEAVNKGASDFILKPIRNQELLLRLRRVIEERNLRESRARMIRDLERLVVTDGLTQLYNSRHFFNQIDVEIRRANRYRHELSLLMMDIDNFKLYNDEYGHLEGDKLLVRIGELTRQCLRKTDSAYRYGGEEFTVILPETGLHDARLVAERIRATVEAETPRSAAPKDRGVTVSLGATQYQPEESADVFVQRADKAMYRSKRKGRNAVSSMPAAKGA